MPSDPTDKILKSTNGDVVIRKSCVVDTGFSNPSQTEPASWTYKVVTDTKFDSRVEIQRYRKEAINRTGSAEVSLSSKVAFMSSSAKLTAGYETKVETYYSLNGTIAECKEVTTEQSVQVTLGPGEGITIYRITISGGAYEYSYMTTDEETDDEIDLGYTIVVDVSPLLYDFLNVVIDTAAGVTTDAGEWRQLRANAVRAKGNYHPVPALDQFISDCGHLWTNGLDQESWRQTVGGMAVAARATDPYQRLHLMLDAFVHTNDPSHNAGQWSRIKQSAVDILTY